MASNLRNEFRFGGFRIEIGEKMVDIILERKAF
jgi:hypothetical protein